MTNPGPKRGRANSTLPYGGRNSGGWTPRDVGILTGDRRTPGVSGKCCRYPRLSRVSPSAPLNDLARRPSRLGGIGVRGQLRRTSPALRNCRPLDPVYRGTNQGSMALVEYPEDSHLSGIERRCAAISVRLDTHLCIERIVDTHAKKGPDPAALRVVAYPVYARVCS
jgi:hypothetical protein